MALLVPAALAQTDDEFVEQVLQNYLDSDEAAFRLILHDPDRSLRLFAALKTRYPMVTTVRERIRTRAYCNAVAQAFAERGDLRPDSELRAAGMRAETPLNEPDASPGPPSRLPGPDWKLSDYWTFLSTRAVAWGNYQACQRMTKSFADALAIALWQAPGREGREFYRDFFLVPKVAQLLLLCQSHQTAAATELANQLIPGLDTKQELLVRTALIAAGNMANEPQLVDQNLPRALELLTTSKDADELSLFDLLTTRFFRDLDREPGLSTEQILSAHDQTFQLLEKWSAGQDEVGAPDTIRKWCALLHQRADEEPGRRKELVERANADLQILYRAAEQASLREPYQASHLIALIDMRIDNAERAARQGLVGESRWERDNAFRDFTRLEEAARQDSQLVHQTAIVFQEIMKEAKSVKDSPFLEFDTRPFDFNLDEGDVSRLRTRLELLDALLESREAKMRPSPAQLKSILGHLERAVAANSMAEKGQGYSGLQDPRFMAMDLLRELKTPGWEDEVLKLSQDALDHCEQIRFRAGIIAALAARGHAQEAKQDRSGALMSAQNAVVLIEQYLLEVGPRSSKAIRMRSQFAETYALMARLQLAQGNQQSAFDTLGRMQQASVPAHLPRREQQVARLESLRGRTGQLETQLESQLSVGQDSSDTEQLLASTKSEFYTALTKLRETHPEYEGRLAIRPVNYTRLQKFIPADTAVVQYFPCAHESYIFVATREALKIRKIPVSDQKITDQVMESRRLAVACQPADDVLRRLYAELMTPVEKDLGDKKVVAFVPTGALCYLPFGSLIDPKSSRYLIETRQCVTLLKSVDLDQLRHEPTSGSGGTLALGNPDSTLPGATREVEEVARLMPQAQAFVGAAASRDRLTRVGSPLAYLHLATHGVLNGTDQNASYLILAGPQGMDRLTVPQICDLKLDGVRLVTLSACQTALGGRNPGSELTTLADAFSVAGANAVIASLWKVSDDSTEKLMANFYEALRAGKSLSQSLQEAQIKLMNESRFAAPYYWAPFVLIGDWR